MTGLYIHIPFCERKCSYCAFYSVVSKDWKSFFQSLENEIHNLPADFSPETIFIGGGTPTAPDFQTLEPFFPVFGKFSPEEFSVEVNPGTLDQQKLDLLKNNGVNRLSIGVQSFDFQCLETLGRIHSADQAEAAFRMARAAGFENISIDLMFGVPGQAMKMLEADLDRMLKLGPEHVAIYNLMYEQGTPMADCTDRLDEELEREMYDLIRARLKAAGFVHYEISNFAKPGFECRHNLLYWTGGEYIGCGPSAHSHWRGARWANVADLEGYLQILQQPTPPFRHPSRGGECKEITEIPLAAGRGGSEWPRREFEEILDPEAKERETLVMGLRLLQGVEVSSGVWNNLVETFQWLERQDLLVIDGHHVRLSEEALFVSDYVFAELV